MVVVEWEGGEAGQIKVVGDVEDDGRVGDENGLREAGGSTRMHDEGDELALLDGRERERVGLADSLGEERGGRSADSSGRLREQRCAAHLRLGTVDRTLAKRDELHPFVLAEGHRLASNLLVAWTDEEVGSVGRAQEMGNGWRRVIDRDEEDREANANERQLGDEVCARRCRIASARATEAETRCPSTHSHIQMKPTARRSC